jgi:hypothetical protein
MTPRTEYASMSDAALRQLDTDYNGCIAPEAQAELCRRNLAERIGAGRRSPAALLAELEARRHGPMSPSERLLRTYAEYRGRDPRRALLATWAIRIRAGW